jgi:hypothetical protein
MAPFQLPEVVRELAARIAAREQAQKKPAKVAPIKPKKEKSK